MTDPQRTKRRPVIPVCLLLELLYWCVSFDARMVYPAARDSSELLFAQHRSGGWHRPLAGAGRTDNDVPKSHVKRTRARKVRLTPGRVLFTRRRNSSAGWGA